MIDRHRVDGTIIILTDGVDGSFGESSYTYILEKGVGIVIITIYNRYRHAWFVNMDNFPIFDGLVDFWGNVCYNWLSDGYTSIAMIYIYVSIVQWSIWLKYAIIIP